MCTIFDMVTMNYHRSLLETKQELARCLEERQKIDYKVARLQAVISHLQNLCAELDQKTLERRTERVVKADLKMGITKLTRSILQETFFAAMTAGDLKKRIEVRKLDLSRYQNPVAVIHTVLKRLVEGGEVKIVPQPKGKKSYQWITPTDRLLDMLKSAIPQSVQKSSGSKESK